MKSVAMTFVLNVVVVVMLVKVLKDVLVLVTPKVSVDVIVLVIEKSTPAMTLVTKSARWYQLRPRQTHKL